MRLTVHGRYTDFGLVSVGLNVRFGSLADIRTAQSYVRFTPESGHSRRTPDTRSFQKPLNRSDASAVYRTVEVIERWPR